MRWVFASGEGVLPYGVKGRARFSLVRGREGSSKALKVCPRCNSPVDPDPEAKYCWYCGAKLAEVV
ncbi:MAG: zinc ribbon domain-containing protein [Thermofilum sp.]